MAGARSRANAGTTRSNDPEATRRDILEVATREFAAYGLAGARIDEIADQTRTSKRMIYYYFGDKEGLYRAVLEGAYSRIRKIEAGLDLEHLGPEEALRTLVRFNFDYHNSNEDFIRLVMIENIHHAEVLNKSDVIQALNVTIIDALREIYGRGLAEGVFRPGLTELDLHWAISALCFFNVSNRPTFSGIFKKDLGTEAAQAERRQQVVDMVLRYVLAKPE